MNFKSIFWTWLAGHESGYPACCIVAFHLRKILVDSPLTAKWMDRRHKRLTRVLDHWNHVPCWGHMLLYKLNRYDVEYHTCAECGWKQLNNPKCSYEKRHDERFAELYEYYEDRIKRGKLFIRDRGRMSDRILTELGYLKPKKKSRRKKRIGKGNQAQG